jgi:putative ABC transport system permease protein
MAAMGWETWRLALEGLRSNRTRAVLTAVGVVIGSASIVLVVTIGLTGRRYVIAQIEAIGSNVVWAELVQTPDRTNSLADELTPGDLQALRAEIPHLAEAAGTREIASTVAVSGRGRAVTLVGATLGFQRIRSLRILRGRFLDADDLELRSRVCVLSAELAQRVFAGDDPVGRSVRLGGLAYTVIGVFQERVATFGLSEIQRDSAIVPFPVLKDYRGRSDFRLLYAQASRPEDVPAVAHQMAALLERRHPGGAKYDVQTLGPILEAATAIGWALTVVLVLVALITLMVSGIGIMNIMLVTVSERTREIGVRRAVGARRAEILAQFLAEAVVISGGGGVGGVMVAVGLTVLVGWLLPFEGGIPISWASVVAALFVACATGVLFGYLPARRASRLEPSEAVRHE